jgi:COP9 signalosome complex subunit 1
VFRRLYLIGYCCPPLREEAAKLAIKEAKKGADVRNFQDAVALLKTVPNYRDTDRLLSDTWAVDQEKRNSKETSRLENELKGYKNNLIKESIRVSAAAKSSEVNTDHSRWAMKT